MMLKKAFHFTGKDLIKLSFAVMLATLLFGLPGLIMMLFLQWTTRSTYAVESAEKHGISHTSASRLGGAAIFGFSLIFYGIGIQSGLIVQESVGIPVIAWFTVGICVVIGLMDDLRSNMLSPRIRLLSTALVFALCLSLWSSLLPRDLGIPILDSILDIPVIGWAVTVIFCIGFVNAINMADGANGLMPGTLTLAFIIFYIETSFMIFAIMMVCCGLFAIFNIISGRLFLGDAGAYGLGSVIAISGLYLFSEKIFSAAFLAVLLAYPCIDLVVTVLRRRIKGRSILLPDNDHLHNRIYFHCQRLFRSRTLANSITGLLIVSFSSGLALLGFIQSWWPVTSNDWGWIFLFQCLLYAFTFVFSGFNRPSSQYVINE